MQNCPGHCWPSAASTQRTKMEGEGLKCLPETPTGRQQRLRFKTPLRQSSIFKQASGLLAYTLKTPVNAIQCLVEFVCKSFVSDTSQGSVCSRHSKSPGTEQFPLESRLPTCPEGSSWVRFQQVSLALSRRLSQCSWGISQAVQEICHIGKRYW